jgi:hypothetical protein
VLLEFDYRVLPRDPWWPHLHSMLWVVVSLVAYHAFTRKIVGSSIAIVALVTVAWDEPIAWTVTWIANRCAMVSATFVALAMLVHVRRRAGGERPATFDRQAGLELGAWTLAFAAGEYAACGLGYLLAYELLGVRGKWSERARALLPAAIVLTAFAVTYLWIGCGVYGAEHYVDPFSDFDTFIVKIWGRLARMGGEAWLGLPAMTDPLVGRYEWLGVLPAGVRADDLAVAERTHAWFVAGIGVVFLPLCGWLGWRYLAPAERRTVGWMSLGAVIALVPVAAAVPTSRTLQIPMFGVGIFVGAVSVAAWRAWVTNAGSGLDWVRRLLLPIAAVLVWAQHTVADVPAIRHQLGDIAQMQAAYTRFNDNPRVRAVDIEDRHVVVLAAPGLVTGIHGFATLHALGRPMPASWHVLTMGEHPLLVRRHDLRTIEIQSVAAAMHDEYYEVLFRRPRHRLRVGDQVGLSLFTAQVVHERPDEGPDAILYRFTWPLEDPRLVFLAPDGEGLRPFPLPAEGQTVAIKAPALPKHPQ